MRVDQSPTQRRYGGFLPTVPGFLDSGIRRTDLWGPATLSRMKVVFIAGPYRAVSEWEVLANIRRAERLALDVWRLGACALCPHKNTAHFGGAAPDSVWLEGAQELLRRSDAVICTSDWEKSEGAQGEVGLARSLGIPVFVDLESLQAWLSRA